MGCVILADDILLQLLELPCTAGSPQKGPSQKPVLARFDQCRCCQVQSARRDGSHRSLPSGQAAARQSGGEPQRRAQQQPQHRQHVRPPDVGYADAARAFTGADVGAAAADDEGLDMFASLPPPDQVLQWLPAHARATMYVPF